MIAPTAIESFLADPGDTYEWIKDASYDDLVGELQINQLQTFATTPRLCQLACYAIGINIPTFCFFLDMRLGKTKLMLDLFSYYRQQARRTAQARPFRGLVLVPQLLHMEPWREQVPIHAPHLTMQILEGSSYERLELLEEGKADLYVLNYQGLTHLLSTTENQRVATRSWERKKQDRRALHPDYEKIAWVGERFQFLVFDESTAVKNKNSLTFEVCNSLADIIPYRYALSGTPFGRSPEDLWAQLYLIDRGVTLGRTITFFREAYFTKKKRYWGGHEYHFKQDLTETLARRMQHRSIRYRLEECQDLPPKIYNPLHISWPEETFAYYDRTYISYQATAVQNALEREAHFMRLRQITAGFLRYTPTDGDPVDITFTPNPKLEALLTLLEEMGEDRKLVIFHFFIRSGELIHEALTRAKIGSVRIWSETKNRTALLKKFRTQDSCRVLIVNETIGSMALDLQVANYLAFYDLPISPITRAQAEARCRGPQQIHPSIIHDLIIRGSVDEKIQAFVQEGRDLRQAILDGSAVL